MSARRNSLALMLAMSTWVAGTGNCAYCHNLADMAADTMAGGAPIYTKLTARRMLLMVRDLNGNYEAHVKNTGVTCYTCHLGKPVPKSTWVYDGKPNQVDRYFLDRSAVCVQTHVVEASNDNRSSVKQTEWTYAVMIKMSRALGVSCNECHNSRAFNSWEQAPPQRVQAFRGVEMVRHANYQYLLLLNSVLPTSRLGPMGDAPKVYCATCHNGVYKPLYGYPMAKDYPALWGRTEWNGHPFPAISTSSPAGSDTGSTGAAGPADADAATPEPVSMPSPSIAAPAASTMAPVPTSARRCRCNGWSRRYRQGSAGPVASTHQMDVICTLRLSIDRGALRLTDAPGRYLTETAAGTRRFGLDRTNSRPRACRWMGHRASCGRPASA